MRSNASASREFTTVSLLHDPQEFYQLAQRFDFLPRDINLVAALAASIEEGCS